MSHKELLPVRNEPREMPVERLEGPTEKCGVIGVVNKDGSSVFVPLVEGLDMLQHRGVDSAGLSYIENGAMKTYKGLGRVREVFQHLLTLPDRGIGHTRYGTDDSGGVKDGLSKSQPVFVEYRGRSLSLGHNGNVGDKLRLILKSRIPDDMDKGPELDSADIGRAMIAADGDWEEKFHNALVDVPLAYSLVILTDDGNIFGLRGPSGTWPLWLGENERQIVLASEDRVQKDMNWREVKPGELVRIDKKNKITTKQLFEEVSLSRCALHDAYMAKPDSRFEGNTTYEEFRRELGRKLAHENPQFKNIDLIVGVPDTATPIAEGFAEEFGRKPDPVLKKIDTTRSFISKNLDEATRIANGKYEITDADAIEGKDVAVIDDSFIKGVSVEAVIKLLKKAGVGTIHPLFSLPMFVEDCDQGAYIRKWLLKALNEDSSVKTNEELAQELGVGTITFMTKEGLNLTYSKFSGKKDVVVCMACMGEEHPLKKILRERKSRVEEEAVVFSA